MSTPIWIAIIGFFGTMATAGAGVLVAIVVNRGEKTKGAASAVETTLRERIQLKKDRIEDLQHDNADLRLKWADEVTRADRAEARADREFARAEHERNRANREQKRADRIQAVIDEMRAEERAHEDER